VGITENSSYHIPMVLLARSGGGRSVSTLLPFLVPMIYMIFEE